MYKRPTIFLIFSFFLLIASSCEKPNHGLVGRWQMIEQLADPGNGSGTFQAVSSNKTLEFHADGTITSNGEICSMSADTDKLTRGTYSLSDSTIHSTSCMDNGGYGSVRFTHHGSTLIVRYPCIEPCAAKFRKR